MIRAGIIGGTGYTAGELIRLLLPHPSIEIDFVYSHSRPNTRVSDIHRDLTGQTELRFTSEVNTGVDVVFLCLGHGHSREFLNTHRLGTHTRIVDLSNEFRLRTGALWNDREFVYGLPELNRDRIRGAKAIANPGCFATAIQLALLPLASRNLLKTTAHIHALTGSTGAGAGLTETGMFSWRLSNISYYKPFVHQHLAEIGEGLETAGASEKDLMFLPIRGNFSRGIFATAYLRVDLELAGAEALYREYYNGAVFTHVTEQAPDLKQVVNTNNCFLHLHKHEGTLLITSVIDNLLKGASGQALENANLMFGLEPDTGLRLKPLAF